MPPLSKVWLKSFHSLGFPWQLRTDDLDIPIKSAHLVDDIPVAFHFICCSHKEASHPYTMSGGCCGSLSLLLLSEQSNAQIEKCECQMASLTHTMFHGDDLAIHHIIDWSSISVHADIV
jgi:hypothetical protein